MIDKLLIENKNPYPKNYDRGFTLRKICLFGKFIYNESTTVESDSSGGGTSPQ